ncbi:glucosaminidase domain-containing protein [uncultured Robinsoniella sp.]|uniref:glucosaminidase domain-containing protein n=1 Tax=uncultured Robinsoniella sp. TaxID=904190 RepID=UPI00374F4936
MTKNEFITAIAGYVQKYAYVYGILVHSPIIAQAILESGWGESKLSAVYHNYFGLKCGTKWTGKSVNMTTQEEYQPGTLTTIKDNFRVYDSMEEGVKGYFEFIQLARYQNLRGITDPQKYLETIKADGYATSSSYVTNTMKLVTQYNLTQYDRKEVDTMTKTEKATQQMEAWARDNSHGYDQIYRWGEKGDFDCSAAVIQAWQNAGVPVKSNGATYTGNMLNVFKRCGFIDVTSQVNRSTGAGLKRGDVLLNTSHHTAMYCGNGYEVEASINEKGTATGGKPGDQTGREFLIRAYRNYPWTHVLRYPESGATTTKKPLDEIAKEVLAGMWGNGDDRKNALQAAGYDYAAVQAKVNSLCSGNAPTPTKSVEDVAREVLAGKWGNGDARKNALSAAGYDYNAVQAKVNQLCNGSGGKSVDTVAREVIAGKWGNGSDRKNKLEAAGYNYAAVQNRVNQLL